MCIGGDVARAEDLNYLIVMNTDNNTRFANEDALIQFYVNLLRDIVKERNGVASAEMVPSVEEFKMYYAMATQGIIYRCLFENYMMSQNTTKEIRRQKLAILVEKAIDAIIDHDLYRILAVGRT
jgi:hypothetical protein